MGEKTISTQVKIDGDIVPDFSQDWEVAFQGEKYIMPLRLPQGAKENTSLNSTIDLTFQHWAIWQLKRWTFVTMQPIDMGTAVADEEVAPVQLNLKDFCDLFGQVLRYYYGDTITIDLNPAWQYDNAPTAIEINHSFIWDVLIKFYELFAVRWEIAPREDNDNTVRGGERYVIKIGYPTTEVDHVFEYGFEGGLLKLERQVQSEEIRNMIKGRGGDTNIPFRYFKDTDPGNPDFAPDPDWVEELKNIYFTNLMPATYRSYIQGWKAAHISKYPGYKRVGENNAYSPWAYRKGFTDEKFHPVEFVADEITLNPQEGDRQVQIYPDYAPFVKEGSSIDVYGPLLAPLDNNDDIYPTIQGTGLDIAVDVEQILSDADPDEEGSDATISTVPAVATGSITIGGNARARVTTGRASFSVPQGRTANLLPGAVKAFGAETSVEVESHTVNVYDSQGGLRSASGIPAGRYSYELVIDIHNMTDKSVVTRAGIESAMLQDASLSEQSKNTFDIWVKDIWESARLAGETDSQYAERVWKPILGDREKNTAKVVFTSGMLLHEDYEFTIVDYPVPDTSKTYTDAAGVKHASHWRIRLAKSDAELEATGLYVPSTQKQGKAGDTFVFTGTELTHVPYIVDAEIRLDDWKKDYLREVKEVKPTFVVTTDRVRLSGEGVPDALINQLRVGASIIIQDERFIGGSQRLSLYLQSLTYTYREPSSDDTGLNPDVEMVLSNDYTTVANPVSIMQGEINALQKQLGSVSNIEQVVRAVSDNRYLRKDRSDRTPYPLSVGSTLSVGGDSAVRGLLTAENGVQFGPDFAPGIVGGVGGLVDAEGRGELQSLVLREFLEVPELRYNRVDVTVGNSWQAPGAGVVESYTHGVTAGSYLIGSIHLRLEDGEIGSFHVGDLCMGIWHYESGNAERDSDDSCGGFTFAGFSTLYFEVTSVSSSNGGTNNVVGIRSRDGYTLRPQAGMTIVAFGNRTDTARQSSVYRTRTYTRYLRGVNDYVWGRDNIAAQFGDLTNLSLHGLRMEGYSAYLDNVYFTGTLQQTGVTTRYFFQLAGDNSMTLDSEGGATRDYAVTAHLYKQDSYGLTQITEPKFTDENGFDYEVHVEVDDGRGDALYTFEPYRILRGQKFYRLRFYLTCVDVGGLEPASEDVTVVSNGAKGEPGAKGADGTDGAPGEQGPEGPAGPVMRLTEWATGIDYYNGKTEVADKVKYLDIVSLTAPNGSKSYWQCLNNHKSSASTTPGSGSPVWGRLSNVTALYTSLLLADNAKIDFMTGQEIIIRDPASGNIVARLGTPSDLRSIIMYAGGAESAAATFILDALGMARFGTSSGERVVIDPAARSVSIFDSAGIARTVLSADTIPSPADALPSVGGFTGDASALRGGRVYTAVKSASTTVGNNTVWSHGIDESLNQRSATATLSVKRACKATLGVLPYMTTSGTGSSAHFHAAISRRASDGTLTDVCAIAPADISNGSAWGRYATASATLAAGEYVVRVETFANGQVSGSPSSPNATLSSTATVTWSGLDVRLTPTDGTSSTSASPYRGQYFANGFSLGNDSGNIVAAWMQNADMRFLARNAQGYGLSVDSAGVHTAIPEGNWRPLPHVLIHGIFSFAKANAGWRNATVFNGDVPSAEWISGTQVGMPLPYTWPQLNSFNLRVTAVAIGATPAQISVNPSSANNLTYDTLTFHSSVSGAQFFMTIELIPQSAASSSAAVVNCLEEDAL